MIKLWHEGFTVNTESIKMININKIIMAAH